VEVTARVPPAVWWVLAAAIAWIAILRFERMMVFVPSREMTAHPGSYGLPFERLRLTASDGTRLRAWWIPGAKADSPVMLCFHGNGGNISSRVDKMKIFHDAGAAQLWVEWRGYGESSGTPDEAGLYRDGLAGWDWLTRERGIAPSRVALYGESLGCGVAVELATRVPAGGLIVDSGFASIAEMGRVVLPWFPARLLRLRFDNLAKLPRAALPTLFLHSPQDDIIPYEQARRNFAAAAGPKSFVDLRGSHNDGFLETGPAYASAIRAFLSERLR
jgi:fermentation-respiration switch protein FrsA (DUF1100 family)